MSNIWERFNNIVTVEEVNEVQKNNFDKPTAGEHVVNLINIEPSETSNGSPTVRFIFEDVTNGSKYLHTMFLQNVNYPDGTARAINDVLKFVRIMTGTELKFTSMEKLCDDLNAVKYDGKIKIFVSYPKEDSKYPKIAILERIKDEYEILEDYNIEDEEF